MKSLFSTGNPVPFLTVERALCVAATSLWRGVPMTPAIHAAA